MVDRGAGGDVFGVVGEHRAGKVEHRSRSLVRQAVEDRAVLTPGFDEAAPALGKPTNHAVFGDALAPTVPA